MPDFITSRTKLISLKNAEKRLSFLAFRTPIRVPVTSLSSQIS